MNACKFQKSAMHTCGSYQFNLGKYQGDLCDVHYWQTEAEQLRQLCREQHEALMVGLPVVSSDPQFSGRAQEMRAAIEKYTKVMGS